MLTAQATPQAAYVFDFNDRNVRDGALAQLVSSPWDGPQGTVQEIDMPGNRVYVTFDEAPQLTGWYASREVC